MNSSWMRHADDIKAAKPSQLKLASPNLVIYDVKYDSSWGRQMRGSCQSKPTCAHKPNLFVLHDIEHELLEPGDEMGAPIPNQINV
jgi:hypothetical protein